MHPFLQVVAVAISTTICTLALSQNRRPNRKSFPCSRKLLRSWLAEASSRVAQNAGAKAPIKHLVKSAHAAKVRAKRHKSNRMNCHHQ